MWLADPLARASSSGATPSNSSASTPPSCSRSRPHRPGGHAPGSMVNHRTLTASMIDSREFLAARHRADTQVLAPAGTRIAFTGGTDRNDHERIWATLDKVRAKHPDMVFLHAGSTRGAERIAASSAANCKVTHVVF